MKSLCLGATAVAFLASHAVFALELKNFVVECDPVDFTVTVGGAPVVEPYVILANSNVDEKVGWVSYIIDPPNPAQPGPGKSGLETAAIAHTTGPADPQQDWSYRTSDASVAINPGSCDMTKHTCEATISLNNSITGSSDGPAQAKATCSAYYALTIPEVISAALAFRPSVQAARKVVEADIAARGSLWETFFPQINVQFNQLRSTTAASIPAMATPRSTANDFQAQALLPLSMSMLYQYRANALLASQGGENARTIENALAMEALGDYVSIELSREQRKILQEAFIEPLQKMAADPQIQAVKQMAALVQQLTTSLTTTMIATKYSLKLVEDDLYNLTGLTVDAENPDIDNPLVPFYSSDVIPTAIPHSANPDEALEAALKSSPAMIGARLTLDATKVAQKIAAWTPFSLNLIEGTTPSWTKTVTAGVPTVYDRNTQFGVGGGVQINIASYRQGVLAARIRKEAQEYSVADEKLTLRAAINKDWLTVGQQIETDCVERSQIDATLIAFGELVEAIDEGKPYDAGAAAQNFPLALQTLTTLYGSVTSAVSALSDVRAQIGDLNSPATWDFSHTTGDFCVSQESLGTTSTAQNLVGRHGFGVFRHAKVVRGH